MGLKRMNKVSAAIQWIRDRAWNRREFFDINFDIFFDINHFLPLPQKDSFRDRTSDSFGVTFRDHLPVRSQPASLVACWNG